MIGDSIHEAIDVILKALELSNSKLKRAFKNRVIIDCVQETNIYLGNNYIKTWEIFDASLIHRKKEKTRNGNETSSLNDFNEAIRKCLPDQLPNLLLKRGDHLFKIGKFKESIKDFELSLLYKSFSDVPEYNIYNKIAQSQAKLGLFSEAVKSLKVSLNLLNSSATLSTETKVGFGKILIQSIKKLQKKDDNESPVGSVKQNFISIENENPSFPGVSSKVKMSLCIFRYSVHLLKPMKELCDK